MPGSVNVRESSFRPLSIDEITALENPLRQ